MKDDRLYLIHIKEAISAFRNVVVYDYLGVSPERIWDIVENDLPGLKQNIVEILGTLE